MRNKVYYLNDEITNNLYTTGSEWMLETNTNYIGQYHSYITGEVYTQSSWKPLQSKKLIKFKNIIQNNSEYTILKPKIKTAYEKITKYIPTVTTDNIKTGYITRYILQNVSSKVIYEVSADLYELYSTNKVDNNLYTGVLVKWFITGARSSSDQPIGSNAQITIKTVSRKNLEQLSNAAKTIPNIQTYFTNLEEFYSDSTYIVTPDINGLE